LEENAVTSIETKENLKNLLQAVIYCFVYLCQR
jgi:hypothetical protein